jgi:hypothetical protein
MRAMTEAQAWAYLAVRCNESWARSDRVSYLCWELEPHYLVTAGPPVTPLSRNMRARMLKRMNAHRPKGRPAAGERSDPWWKTPRSRVAFCRRMAKLAVKEAR